MWPELYEQVQVEIEQIDHLFELYYILTTKVTNSTPDFVETAALATMLHSFYNGIENIFKRIALRIDENLPVGATGHSDLLEKMSQPTKKRSAIISNSLRIQLRDYLSFRHVFRHAYSFNIQWSKMSYLVKDCGIVWQQLKKELKLFFNEI